MPVTTLSLMTVTDLKERMSQEEWFILDMRSKDEHSQGHIEGSLNLYAGTLDDNHRKVPRDKPVAVMCKTGTGSSFASSVLLRHGFKNLHNVLGVWTPRSIRATTLTIINVVPRFIEKPLLWGEFHAENNSDGLLLGSTGEAILLTRDERKKIIDTVIDEASGKLPVMINVLVPVDWYH